MKWFKISGKDPNFENEQFVIKEFKDQKAAEFYAENNCKSWEGIKIQDSKPVILNTR